MRLTASVFGMSLCANLAIAQVDTTIDLEGGDNITIECAGDQLRINSTTTATANASCDNGGIASSPSSRFHETFDGEPSTPTAFSSPNWDVAIFTRDIYTRYQPKSGIQADHGSACEPPPAQHEITTYESLAYRCKNHVMTAMNDIGFGHLTLTPNRMVDFSAGVATIEFDISTFRKGGYDWVELFISPFDDHLVHPVKAIWEVAGPPRNGIEISMNPGGQNRFLLTTYVDGVATPYQFCGELCEGVNHFIPYDSPKLPLIPSQRRRDKFRVTISQERISFGIIDYYDGESNDKSFYWLDDVAIGPLSWNKGVVQFSHVSFNPKNNCDNVPDPVNPPDNPDFVHECDGDTWHWDNIVIDPSVPFTIIPTAKVEPTDTFKQRYVDPLHSRDNTVSFVQPSPENAYLRFSAIGDFIEISVDDGATWETVAPQPQVAFNPARFNNYFHPIPSGVQRVQFRGGRWWGGEWHARDISIWRR